MNGKHQINREESVITITGLQKSFDDLNVLTGVDFTLFRGENVAVLGKSGSGKSVLIKIIVGAGQAGRSAARKRT
jgi:phospholipid/cholesterol/gamma-HCH transport system ATP-binding protein